MSLYGNHMNTDSSIRKTLLFVRKEWERYGIFHRGRRQGTNHMGVCVPLHATMLYSKNPMIASSGGGFYETRRQNQSDAIHSISSRQSCAMYTQLVLPQPALMSMPHKGVVETKEERMISEVLCRNQFLSLLQWASISKTYHWMMDTLSLTYHGEQMSVGQWFDCLGYASTSVLGGDDQIDDTARNQRGRDTMPSALSPTCSSLFITCPVVS
jgi:hypothetical protein